MVQRRPPKVSNKGQTRAFYVFSSQRLGKLIKVRSKLEYRACLHFEVHPDLEALDYEPETFTVRSANGKFHYTPDFRVQRRNERLLFVEVKYTEDLQSDDLQRKLGEWRLQKPSFADFIIMTEGDLGDVYESNCLFISTHGPRWSLGADELSGCLARIKGPLTCVADLIPATRSITEALRLASVLHWRGLATIDLTKALGIETTLTWRQSCESNLKKA